jgi:glycogen operon protein
MLEFTRKLLHIRKSFPVLNRGRFLTGNYNEYLNVKDVTWLTPDAEEMTDGHWADPNAKCFGMLLDGRAQATGIKRLGSDATLLLVFNAHDDVVNFTLPSVADGMHWIGLIDTNDPGRADRPAFEFGHRYQVTGRSMLLFALLNGSEKSWHLSFANSAREDIDAWIVAATPK